ncbi:hypothetical protein B4U79_11872 [Dinothrombium tinctorium]|uniref:tRNA (guanine(10)-N(2))-methyltransferase TRMT11 n=1 Tax=Dinothrombium tinctorium TaxID=1965070 RepID=A0A3S4R230_9ACAR|nr:hypothetical protein B4U79_00977 [Dinothrombium tinctorium]RWS10587.1 hypothetical protein B4U79_11872 [Dinothrombium tinctorium]
MCKTAKYLIWFAHEHVEFRLPELESVISLESLSVNWLYKSTDSPYVILESNECDIRRIAERSVMIKYIVELWAFSNTEEQLYEQLRVCKHCQQFQSNSERYSFKIVVDSFGKKMPFDEQIKKIERLSFLNFKGVIDLKNPDNLFYLIEYNGIDPNNIPEKPYALFFGRWIADGQRKIIQDLNLKKRKFISNTSLDPKLSLIMANIAKIKEGDLVLDPFVGSGSVLVAAAKFGAFVFGTDIDYLLMYGRSRPSRCGVSKREPDETIFSNLQQYSLESKYLDVIVADASLPLWRQNIKFDAIVTDPPYGIREASAKIGSERNYKIPPELCEGHIPAKIRYNFMDIIKDLLEFSASHLKLGGRLLYWVPVTKPVPTYDIDSCITHPCFKLISKSEQIFGKHYSRLLICVEKFKEL